MVRYVLRRLVASVGLLILGSMAVFLLMRVIPGDPTITKLGGSIEEVDQATLDAIRAELGLDKSIVAQYVDWVGGILHGDFGASYFSQFSVTALVEQRYGATLLLAFMAMLIGAADRGARRRSRARSGRTGSSSRCSPGSRQSGSRSRRS